MHPPWHHTVLSHWPFLLIHLAVTWSSCRRFAGPHSFAYAVDKLAADEAAVSHWVASISVTEVQLLHVATNKNEIVVTGAGHGSSSEGSCHRAGPQK